MHAGVSDSVMEAKGLEIKGKQDLQGWIHKGRESGDAKMCHGAVDRAPETGEQSTESRVVVREPT